MKTKAIETGITSSSGAEEWLEAVRHQVTSLRFGVVQVVIHDSRVVQIEKTEKIRLEANAGGR
ncbi:MAG: YezD family protein [Verrucomicrobiota bacterium]